MFSYATPSTKLEPLLHAACRRAVSPNLSFIDQIHACRSVLALAREVRLRCAGALFDGGNQALFARLAEVCERACVLGLDPELPFADAILVQRLAVRLSRAARQAGDGGAAAHPISTQHPMHREKPARHEAAKTAKRVDEFDYRLSAWRDDHTTERDRRAHEKLRTVIDERVISTVKAMNQRDREAREAAARAAAR